MDNGGSDRWFFEPAVKGFDYRYELEKIIYEGESRFQKIGIYDTAVFGRMLVLDGCVQTTVKDEYCYHEMLVYPALCSHPAPESVLIIGGGDGGALRRVLEFPVKRADMVELDAEVVELCQKYLPEISAGAFADSRANLLIEDGIKFIENHKDTYDVIIIDSTDPVGPAENLFAGFFYKNIFEALRKNGIVVTQSGSPFFQPEVINLAVKGLSRHFPIARPYFGFVTTYPGVFWSYSLGSKTIDPAALSGSELSVRIGRYALKTELYSPEAHLAAFTVYPFVERMIGA